MKGKVVWSHFWVPIDDVHASAFEPNYAHKLPVILSCSTAMVYLYVQFLLASIYTQMHVPV